MGVESTGRHEASALLGAQLRSAVLTLRRLAGLAGHDQALAQHGTDLTPGPLKLEPESQEGALVSQTHAGNPVPRY